MTDHCYFQNKKVVCAKHKSEVCGVCCSDFALLNELKRTQNKDTHAINKAISIYFKKPKQISRSGANRVASPEFESLLKSVSSKQTSNYLEIAALCGFMCYTSRFSPQCRSRITNILQKALEHDINIIDQLKQQHTECAKDIKNRKKKRKQKMKAKQMKKRNELKKKGIRSKQKKYNTASWKDRARSGEINMSQNITSILLLLAENGCTELGTFFAEYEECSDTLLNIDNELYGSFQDLKIEEKKGSDMVHLNDSQTKTLEKMQKFFEFQFKYGTAVPIDDPQTWNNRKIEEFLAENNIKPKPKPARPILIKVCKQLIKMKSDMMMAIMNMPDDDDELKRRGRDVLSGKHRLLGDFSDFSESESENEEMMIVVDAQYSIPESVDPFMLKSWSFPVATMFKASMLCSTLTTKVFQDMQESFAVIAKSIDNYNCVEKIPMFFVQNKEQTHAINIIVICVKHCNGLPMVVVKYFYGKRATLTLKKSQNMMREAGQGRLMQAIEADLIEVKLIHRLLRKNRNKLVQDVVQKKEKEYCKGWRMSVFMPYNDKKVENKCPSCDKLASLRCSRCKKVSYCSRECQKTDWKSHKKVCKKTEL